MCKKSYDIFWCSIGGHQIGDKVPARRYVCSAADSIGFGGCGNVTEGWPSTFFLRCRECLRGGKKGKEEVKWQEEEQEQEQGQQQEGLQEEENQDQEDQDEQEDQDQDQDQCERQRQRQDQDQDQDQEETY